ncbi:hypothetical protein PLICRDRAFT_160002 [Plicaturopsis crispa FD-325 SS-3]|nr:hypothetical protein PLICRDRAFT_160002 [Plicaturopsis crispa FD-325 SS-3]
MTQPRISAFFSPPKPKGKRRAGDVVDLTLDDDDKPPTKRARSTAEQWRFVPSEPGPSNAGDGDGTRTKDDGTHVEDAEPTKDDKAKAKRHEAFKKKLLGDNNPFLRRTASEDARAKEADAHAKESDENVGDSDASDDGFKDIMQSFSLKGKGTRKAGTSTQGKTSTSAKGKGKARADDEVGPSGQTYTPLEQQVRALKTAHPDALLMIEVGYKYRFFGADAQVAAKELGIVCFPDRNFLTASVPSHRLEVHLKKLLAQGHKVALVQQVETAALKKAGDSRGAPFERRVVGVYTDATYVDALDSADDTERYGAPAIMCLVENIGRDDRHGKDARKGKGKGKGGGSADGRTHFGMIVVSPSTGDVVWDDFDDTHLRTELETRLVHCRPAELLLPSEGLSAESEGVVGYFKGTGERLRIERAGAAMAYSDAFDVVAGFYASDADKDEDKGTSSAFAAGTLMAAAADFPPRVVVALALAIRYLVALGLAGALRATQFFARFATRAHMLLGANTLANLEIYRNETDGTARGSLVWILDHTTTRFGARMLRSWVGRPLVDVRALQARVDAVEEILASTSEALVTLRELLRGTPDLARGLCRIQYGKCTPEELAVLLPAFSKIARAFRAPSPHDTDSASAQSKASAQPTMGFKSPLLNDILRPLPALREPVAGLVREVKLEQAAAGRKDAMWADQARYPDIEDCDMAIQAVEVELKEELAAVRKTLRKPSLKWASVAGDEYVIEVPKAENRPVPPTWHLLSGTKHLRRYHTPTTRLKVQELAQYREARAAAAHRAFQSFLAHIAATHYAVLRAAVHALATADCLFSLARVALQEGYVRPRFVEGGDEGGGGGGGGGGGLEIVDGRHPVVEALRADPFVPNSCCMGAGAPRSKIITGPNMGGKSSSVKMVALIAIMAQIGSYVPAKSVTMGTLDAVLTRMGASDELSRGRSTFMVEMSETSEILHTATDRSLVILDELGRGTSTFDGMAIANAVLEHLVVHTKCKTLFITHYPLVATDLARRFPADVQNLHMGFSEDTRIDGTRDITFLYRLTAGIAAESFGVECARLAGLPEPLLAVAVQRSEALRREVEARSRRNRYRKCARLVERCLSDDASPGALEELRDIMSSITTTTTTARPYA